MIEAQESTALDRAALRAILARYQQPDLWRSLWQLANSLILISYCGI